MENAPRGRLALALARALSACESVRQSCEVNELGHAVLRPPWSRP